MFNQTIFLILLIALVHLSVQDHADPSYLCSQYGVRYRRGCSEFAAEALDRAFQTTSGYSFQGNIDGYTIPSGTLIGFPGHVGFYYDGDCNGRYCKFIDVNGAGGSVRCLNSYGQRVYFAYYD